MQKHLRLSDLKFSYNVKNTESCKQQSYCDEDRHPQDKMIGNLLWRKVKQADDTVIRNCNAIWFIMCINDLVPDVGYPHTWNQKCKQDKQCSVSPPKHNVKAKKSMKLFFKVWVYLITFTILIRHFWIFPH